MCVEEARIDDRMLSSDTFADDNTRLHRKRKTRDLLRDLLPVV